MKSKTVSSLSVTTGIKLKSLCGKGIQVIIGGLTQYTEARH